MDLSSSGRESVIETAIETISTIGRDTGFTNSVWSNKEAKICGTSAASYWRTPTNVRRNDLPTEIAEDSMNLHSDASCFYRENKFESQSTHASDYQQQACHIKNNSEATLDSDSSKEQTCVVNHYSQNVKIHPKSTMKATSSKAVNSGRATRTNTPESDSPEKTKGTLHGLEVVDSKFPTQTNFHLPRDNASSTETPARRKSHQAKKINFKGLYSCKIIRRERDAGVKLQRELQFRRQEIGSPKVVTLVEKHRHGSVSPSNLEAKSDNSSFVEQMIKWLNIAKRSNDHKPIDCSDTNLEKRDKEMEIMANFLKEETNDSLELRSPSAHFENEIEPATSATSASRTVPLSPEQNDMARPQSKLLPETISDAVTYKSMKRGNIYRRIQDLKKLKRNKRKIKPANLTGIEFKLDESASYDANIAVEQTYKKGFPECRSMPKRVAVLNECTEKVAERQLLPSTSVKEKSSERCHNRNDTSIGIKKYTEKKKAKTKITLKRSPPTDLLQNSTTTLHDLEHLSKDASCGPEPYPRLGKHGYCHVDAYRDVVKSFDGPNNSTDDDAGEQYEKTRYTDNTNTNVEKEVQDSNTLLRHLCQNLSSNEEIAELSGVNSPTNMGNSETNGICIVYTDGCGHIRTIPPRVWAQIRSSLFQ